MSRRGVIVRLAVRPTLGPAAGASREAVEIAEARCRDHPTDLEYRENLARYLEGLGTNETEAIRILNAVGMTALSDMDEAVQRVVQLAKEVA